MNNINPIKKADRLTEVDVHSAANELKESGKRTTSLEVYKHLNRGSLTTITNFLKTWNQSETQNNPIQSLNGLPEGLKKIAEDLIIKIWTESKKITEMEINNERETIRQTEELASKKIISAEEINEEQLNKIQELIEKIKILENENRTFLEKTAMLEGELKAYKNMKPASTLTKSQKGTGNASSKSTHGV